MICSVHQPNFFPWLGYINKIARSHKFVILDDAQYPKKGGTWLNRVAVYNDGGSMWLTAPIVRKHGLWRIDETDFQSSGWRKKMVHALQTNYGKASHFKECKDLIFDLLNFPSNRLVEYNFNAIESLSRLLDIDLKSKVCFASSLSIGSTSTTRLIDIIKAVDCDTYLCGGGAGYQDDDLFLSEGIKLTYQNFHHPIYRQFENAPFVPGLSIIDVIIHVGIEGARHLLLNDC